MSYRKRVDGSDDENSGTHDSVRSALRAGGWMVKDMSAVGRGFPDLLCVKHGRLELVEVKNPNQPPSKRKLNPRQVKLHKEFADAGYRIRVLMSVEEALLL